MFTFLLSLGMICILLGLYNEKIRKGNSTSNELEENSPSQEITDIKERVESLEKLILYGDVPQERSEPRENLFSQDLEKANIFLHKYKLICKYEDDNLPVEEICSKLNMKKGEILLLKNLYKNY